MANSQRLADAERWRDQASQTETEQSTASRWIENVLGIVVMLTTAGLSTVCLYVARDAGLVPRILEHVFDGLVGVALWGGFFAGLYLHLSLVEKLHAIRAPRSLRSPETSVNCPSCGAANVMVAGTVVERCAYCDGALFPDRATMKADMEHTELAFGDARRRRVRSERVAEARSRELTLHPAWIVVSVLALPVFGTTIALSCQIANRKIPFGPSIILAWLVCLSIVLGALVLPRLSGRRWRRRCLRLASEIGGTVIWGLSGVVQWITIHWAGPYDETTLPGHPRCTGITFSAGDYPALLVLDRTKSGAPGRDELQLLLAAWVPGLSDSTSDQVHHNAESRELAQWLEDRHWAVEYNPGGLILRAHPKLARRARRLPDRVLAEAPAVISATIRLGKEVGALPETREADEWSATADVKSVEPL